MSGAGTKSLCDAAAAVLASDRALPDEKALATHILATLKAAPRFEPLNDGVLVYVHEEHAMTKGGIYLPEMARKPMNQGEVMAVGPGRMLESGTRVPTSVKRRQVVLFGAYSGSQIQVDGEKFTLMREIDVLGILHPKPEEAAKADGLVAETVEAPPKGPVDPLASIPGAVAVVHPDIARQLESGPNLSDIEKAVEDMMTGGPPVTKEETPTPVAAGVAEGDNPPKFARNLDAL